MGFKTASGWFALLLVASGCSSPSPEGEAATESALEGELVVNGVALSESEAKWVRFVASDVVPRLGGSDDAKLTVASRVAWWSLKEGVFDVDNPLAYSNCGNRHVGPLEPCSAGAWQVGLAGAQVGPGDVASLEALASQLFPGRSAAEVIEETARQAGVSSAGVAGTTGRLRASWLLRNGAIGFTAEEPSVTRECVEGAEAWCFGTGWPSTRSFAPNAAAATRAIGDLRAILAGLRPGGPSKSSVAPGGGAEYCGQRAARLKWRRAYCEQAKSERPFSRVACNGTGAASVDCTRCCEVVAVGPDHTDESCGAYAKRMGFRQPRCESATNKACGGSGPSTSDGCLHCCDTP